MQAELESGDLVASTAYRDKARDCLGASHHSARVSVKELQQLDASRQFIHNILRHHPESG
jgi:hypothetical protein